MLSKEIILFALLISTTCIAYCLMNKKNHIPLQVLFDNPTTISPRISPDGKLLAHIEPDKNNVLNVTVKKIGEETGPFVTGDTNKGIRSFIWCQDNQNILYAQDNDGDQNEHIFKTNIHTKKTVDLTPYDGVKAGIIAHNKFKPNELLFKMNKEDITAYDVYQIDLITLETTLVQKNWDSVNQWLATKDLEIKAGMDNDDTGAFIFKVKESDGIWKRKIRWELEDSFTSDISHFSLDGKSVYLVDSRGNDTGVLVKHNLETDEQTFIAQHPTSEVSSVFVDSETREILAVQFYTDRAEWQVVDQSVQEDFNAIRKIHPGDFDIVSKSNDQQTWIVKFDYDQGPEVWFLYDRKTKTGTKLFYSRPELLKYKLQPMHSFKFKAQDGLEINGYITYPENYESKKSPLVLNVHGGPWDRDHWGYNAAPQWFANRGYICLQINYRGSTGYGKDFINAGDKEWAGKMHTDLIDGVEWAKKTGFVDESKIAIYGGSYGGYAALVGATFTPDYFTCAIDVVGMSNMVTSMRDFPPYWKSDLANYVQRVGHHETDTEYLESISPLFKVDNIKIPLLIAQGGNDPLVTQIESEQIVAAMKERGIPHQYLLFEDEGHGFAKPHNRLHFCSVAEKFLEEHLGN